MISYVLDILSRKIKLQRSRGNFKVILKEDQYGQFVQSFIYGLILMLYSFFTVRQYSLIFVTTTDIYLVIRSTLKGHAHFKVDVH